MSNLNKIDAKLDLAEKNFHMLHSPAEKAALATNLAIAYALMDLMQSINGDTVNEQPHTSGKEALAAPQLKEVPVQLPQEQKTQLPGEIDNPAVIFEEEVPVQVASTSVQEPGHDAPVEYENWNDADGKPMQIYKEQLDYIAAMKDKYGNWFLQSTVNGLFNGVYKSTSDIKPGNVMLFVDHLKENEIKLKFIIGMVQKFGESKVLPTVVKFSENQASELSHITRHNVDAYEQWLRDEQAKRQQAKAS